MRPGLEERFFWPRRAFMTLTPRQTEYGLARVVVLPMPYDATASGPSAGAREGPGAIIAASTEIELFDLELRREPAAVGIHTLPDLIPVLSAPEDMLATVRGVTAELLRDGKLVVGLGGDHSLTVGLVQAHLEKYRTMGVLYLDAHADLLDEYLGTRYGHASVARRLLDLCPTVQVGVRSAGPDEAEAVIRRREAGLLFTPDDLRAGEATMQRILASLPELVYVTIDLDVFDPSLMAAVDLPEPGGLLWHEVLALLREVARERQVVGFDLVELSPREGPRACSFLAAKLAYKLIGYATGEVP